MPSLPSPGAAAILTAASTLFAEQPYDSVSIAQIAVRARTSKGNVFHHFTSKEALYVCVMKAATSEHLEFTEKLLEQAGDATSKLRQLYFHQLRAMSSDPARTRLVHRELGEDGNPQARCLALQVLERQLSGIVALFEQGRQRGEFREDFRPESAAFMLIAAQCFFFNSREGFNFNPRTRYLGELEIYAEETFSVAIRGILADRSENCGGRGLAELKAARTDAPVLGINI